MSIGFMESSCPICKGIGHLPQSAQPTPKALEVIQEAVSAPAKKMVKKAVSK